MRRQGRAEDLVVLSRVHENCDSRQAIKGAFQAFFLISPNLKSHPEDASMCVFIAFRQRVWDQGTLDSE